MDDCPTDRMQCFCFCFCCNAMQCNGGTKAAISDSICRCDKFAIRDIHSLPSTLCIIYLHVYSNTRTNLLLASAKALPFFSFLFTYFFSLSFSFFVTYSTIHLIYKRGSSFFSFFALLLDVLLYWLGNYHWIFLLSFLFLAYKLTR